MDEVTSPEVLMRDYTWQVQDEAAARQVSGAGIGRACPVCGGYDGMMAVPRDWARVMLDAGEAFYCVPGDLYILYIPCDVCNQAGVVYDGYEPLTEAQVRRWIGTYYTKGRE